VFSIRDIPSLVVVTTSLAVAAALQYAESVETILLGGKLQHGRPDLGGGFTEEMLGLFSADFAFQGADGIDLEGYVYNCNVESARVSQKMRRQAERSYILCDSSKVGRTALFKFGNLKDGCGLITDNEIKPQHLQTFRELLGIDVTIAPTGTNWKKTGSSDAKEGRLS
jgi:DeoR/GlpR family transcriptional regulator of sugar metabolism